MGPVQLRGTVAAVTTAQRPAGQLRTQEARARVNTTHLYGEDGRDSPTISDASFRFSSRFPVQTSQVLCSKEQIILS